MSPHHSFFLAIPSLTACFKNFKGGAVQIEVQRRGRRRVLRAVARRAGGCLSSWAARTTGGPKGRCGTRGGRGTIDLGPIAAQLEWNLEAN